MKCPKCGKAMKPGAKACKSCGWKGPVKKAKAVKGKPKTSDGYGAFSGDRD